MSRPDIPQPRGVDDMNAAAKALGRYKKDLLVLDANNDPFNAGTPTTRRLAEWFTDLWHHFGYSGGGVHVKRVNYRAQANGDIYLPSRELYVNTDECHAVTGKGSRHARDLGLIDPRTFIDRHNREAHVFAPDPRQAPEPSWEWDEPAPWTVPHLHREVWMAGGNAHARSQAQQADPGIHSPTSTPPGRACPAPSPAPSSSTAT